MSARKPVLLDDMGMSAETRKTYNSCLNIFFRRSGVRNQQQFLMTGDGKLQEMMDCLQKKTNESDMHGRPPEDYYIS